jgi:hypothetical protein
MTNFAMALAKPAWQRAMTHSKIRSQLSDDLTAQKLKRPGYSRADAVHTLAFDVTGCVAAKPLISSSGSNGFADTYSGRGLRGLLGVLSVRLYVINTTRRGQGVRFGSDACVILVAKNTAEPGGPSAAQSRNQRASHQSCSTQLKWQVAGETSLTTV